MSDSKNGDSKVSDSFRRFEDLTKRLLAVPKKEADAKMEEFKELIDDERSTHPRGA